MLARRLHAGSSPHRENAYHSLLDWKHGKLVTAPAPYPIGRWSTWAGIALIGCGLLHGLAGLLHAEGWEGPLSYRKPLLFGVSFGVTLLSLGWLAPKLPRRPWDSWLELGWVSTLTAEVLLVSLQYWRGQPSHFNSAGALNVAIESTMTLLVSVATALLTWVTVRSLGRLQAPPDMRLAIRAGLVFLWLSCLVGFAISFLGHQQLAIGLDPEVFGTAGVLKFPHGVAIHALQVLPLLAFTAERVGLPPLRRWWFVAAGVGLHGFLLIYSIVQTATGRPRWGGWENLWSG